MTLQFGDKAMIQQVKREEALSEIAETVQELITKHADILQPNEIGYAIGTGVFFETENNDMDFEVMIKRGISKGLKG